jgi:hypothetical protein
MEKRHFVVLNKLIIKALDGKNLFPVIYILFIKDFTEFAVNYDKWDICDPACSLGQELEVQFINLSKKLWLEGLAKTGTWSLMAQGMKK